MNNENAQGQLYIVGTRGYSAYEVAVQNGFVGTEQEWLDSLIGPQGPLGPEGKSAYEISVENGYIGTEEEWVNNFLTPDGYYNKDTIDNFYNIHEVKLNKKAYYYDTVADMKADLSLKQGDMIITLGYYEPNDGGGGEYRIIDDSVEDDGGRYHLLNNNLFAELIIKDSIYLEQFGAYGDGEHDDTNSIQSVIVYCKQNNIKLTSSKNKVYLISSPLDISNISCDFNFATFKTNSEIAIFTYDSTEYYADIKNITIDCNNIATDGLKIIEGRKALINNINIINVGNNGFSYLKGYEMLVNNINIYGNVISNNNVGLNIEGGDSYFNNIIIIDCVTAVKNTTSFNYYNNVHAWMYRNPYVLFSKFLEINGGRVVLNNCYSDTYRYCIYQKNAIPVLLISNFVNVYNRGILTPEILDGNHPYFMYCETTGGNSLTRLTNSNIDGYSDTILTYLTNLDNFSGEIVSSLIKNCDNNISFTSLSDANNTTGVEVLTSNVNKVGKIVYVDGQFKVDATSTKTFTIGTIPYYFRPSHEIIAETSYGSRYGFTGMCYMYIATNGRISVTLSNDTTGNQVIKLNSSFVTTVEQ